MHSSIARRSSIADGACANRSWIGWGVDAVPEAEADAFYEANKDRIPIPKAQALPQVKQYLIERSRTRYREILVTRLKKEYGVRSYLEPIRAQIATAGFPSKGPANAPVTALLRHDSRFELVQQDPLATFFVASTGRRE